MKTIIQKLSIFCLILVVSTNLFCQEIQIDSIFNSSYEIFPFERIESLSSISMEGEVHLYGDTSLVRVILEDDQGVQYMIFETYPLICSAYYINFTSYCDETCALEADHPYSIIIQVDNASLNLKSFHYTTDHIENAENERFSAKRLLDAQKIDTMNYLISMYDMNWVAGDNGIVALYYDQKRNLFGDGYNLRGYEYYMGGIFESLGHDAYPKASPEMVWSFDWRNRHGANNPTSGYWDGDLLGTGWLTAVKHQGYICNSCWAFSSAGVTESIANIYNPYPHEDYDLSEEDLISCSGAGSCSGGYPLSSLNYIIDSGIVTEDCFPYDSADHECESAPKCSNPNPIIKISDTLIVDDFEIDSIRVAIIKNGPLVMNYTPAGSRMGHSVTLCGFQFNPDDSTINWIFKDSYGLGAGEKGFRTEQIAYISSSYAAIGPVLYNDIPLKDTCYDKDGDGYFYWGTGHRPENFQCSEIEDCDDNNRFVGGYDENYNCPCLLEFVTILQHIRRDTTWNGTVDINRKIAIDSGACLTIRDTAYFSPEAQILVYQGGKLIIDGGVLTNACPETLWSGIILYGYDTAQYFNQYFGVVNIINEGTIENARIGISTNYCPLCKNPNSSSGGIIRAEKAIFRNNGIAIEFTPFRNIYQGVERPYMASFTDCRFEYNEYLQDQSDFKYFARLSQINGIRFKGCDFICDTLSINSINEETFKYRTGIYAVGSQFYVEDACLSQSVPCSQFKTSHFHGLNYGIYALGIDGRKTVTVKKTIFDLNKTGIYLSAIPDATIVQDTFEIIREKTNSLDTLCGLYLDNCTGYQVEENIFKGDYYYEFMGIPFKRVGVVVNNSGEEYNQIYNNTFDSLFIGTLAMNVNRNSKDKTIGLQILCNDYDSSYYDIAVTAEEHINESGIADPQGSSTASPTSPANNTFSYTWHNSESDYANDCQEIVYWHLKDTIPYNTKPKHHSSPEVEPRYNENYNQEYIKDTCCPSSFTSGGGGSIEALRFKINEYTIKSDSVKSILHILVDGGDTYQMTVDVQNSLPENAEETAEMLLSNSPYLSDSVMLTAIEKENVLTPAMITSVLFENPQAAKSDTIQQALDDREYLLTVEQRTIVDQGWFTVGAKELIEANYSHYIWGKSEALNSLIRYYKTDTLLLNSSDSIINLFLEDNSIYSRYSLAFEYLNRGDTTNAWDFLSSIPVNFDLTNTELLRHQQYIDYFHVLISSGIYQGYNEIDTSVQESLFSLASSAEGEIKTLSRNTLVSENMISYNEPFIFPDPNLKSTKYKKHNAIPEITDNSLKLYPNPAMNYVMVDFSLVKSASCQNIRIIDMSGRKCYDQVIDRQRGFLLMSLTDLSDGMYILQIYQNDKPVISKKFVISK